MSREQTYLSVRRLILAVIIGLFLTVVSALPIMADGSGGQIDPPAKSSILPGQDTNSATILVVEVSLLLTSSIL